RLGEDAEHGGVRARLAGRDGAIDSLACESLVPRPRPSLAVEVTGEIDQEPIPLLSGERLQLAARDGVELKDPRGGLTPRRAGDERHANSEQQHPPAPDHTLLHAASGLRRAYENHGTASACSTAIKSLAEAIIVPPPCVRLRPRRSRKSGSLRSHAWWSRKSW